uniref:Uncharacterized protein n=1 Tax=Panagrolaimus sp. PS1159 TaxID=55785 RepID=A0AC35FGN5_9BILA
MQSQWILRSILNEHYDPQLVPNPKGVVVSVELALQTFYDISETSASFTADVLLSQIWHDERLKFNQHSHCLQNLTLSYIVTSKIWQPFVNFVNSKKSELHTSPTPNTFVLIYPNGTVSPCFMDRSFENFPMDEHVCGLVLESYAYNTAKVRLKWRDWDPVFSYSSKTVLPDYILSEINWDKNTFIYAAGQWDQLTVNFVLTRMFAFHIFQIYLPLQTNIFISWISFYLDTRALPARMTLGVSAMMALTFQYGAILRTLPRVAYVKAVDVWVFASVSYVFLSLIESAIVGYLERIRYNKRRKLRKKWLLNESRNDSLSSSFGNYGTFYSNGCFSPCPHQIIEEERQKQHNSLDGLKLIAEMEKLPSVIPAPAKKGINFIISIFEAKLFIHRWKEQWCDPDKWDLAARKYFPLSFFIFNIIYWSYYLGYIKFLKPYLKQ